MSEAPLLPNKNDKRVFFGNDYTINQSMVITPDNKPGRDPAGGSNKNNSSLFFTLIGFIKKILMYTAGVIIGPPIALVFIPIYAILMSNKRFSQYAASKFIPYFMNMADKSMRKIKLELLKDVKGKVLDVGAGGGTYLKYLNKESVKEVVELEPNANLIPKIKKAAVECGITANPNITIRYETVFTSDLVKKEAGTYDCVVFGNVLCEVPSQANVLNEINTLLKDGGYVFFFEHVAYPKDQFLHKVQNALNPLWCHLSDGCNCNRNTLAEIKKQPWDIEAWELMLPTLPVLKPHVVGIARKRETSKQTPSASDSSSKM